MSEPLSFRRQPLIFVPDDALALLFFWRWGSLAGEPVRAFVSVAERERQWRLGEL